MIDQPTTIKYTVFGIALLVFCLFISSCTVADKCYLEPCMQGDGIAYVWGIHPGIGFQAVVTSLALIAHSYFTFNTLFKTAHSNFRYGILTGSSGFVAILMMLQLIFFSSRSSMLGNLEKHASSVDAAGDAAYYEHYSKCHASTQDACNQLANNHCSWVSDPYQAIGALSKGCYRRMTINSSTKDKLNAMAVFSAFLFFAYGGFFILLVKWQEDFSGSSSNNNGGRSQGPEPSRVHYAGYEGQVDSTQQLDDESSAKDGADISYQQDE